MTACVIIEEHDDNVYDQGVRFLWWFGRFKPWTDIVLGVFPCTSRDSRPSSPPRLSWRFGESYLDHVGNNPITNPKNNPVWFEIFIF
jgi:hypothetical protein